MRMFSIFLTIILMSSSAQAQTLRRLLVVIQPQQDSLLLNLQNRVREQLVGLSLECYEPAGHPGAATTAPPDVSESMAKGKEAYEFLKFNESINLLDAAARRLQAHLDSTASLNQLRETRLYLAMDYLALGRDALARDAVDAYLCNSGTPELDHNLWPPNLIKLNEDRFHTVMDSAVPITITTNPPGATVFIDARKAGRAPVTQNLLPCTHYVTATLSSCLPKHTMMTVTRDTRTVVIKLEPCPMAFTQTSGVEEQSQELIARYHVDGILVLSSTVTQTAITETTVVHATLRSAQSHSSSSLTIAYRTLDQASRDLAAFLQPSQEKSVPSSVLPVLKDTPDTARAPAPDSWYKNPWLWTAGAVLITGGIVYAVTADHRGSPAKTGSVSVQW